MKMFCFPYMLIWYLRLTTKTHFLRVRLSSEIIYIVETFVLVYHSRMFWPMFITDVLR